jgi:hypothetical protein
MMHFATPRLNLRHDSLRLKELISLNWRTLMTTDAYETKKIEAIKDVADVLRLILAEMRAIRQSQQVMASKPR